MVSNRVPVFFRSQEAQVQPIGLQRRRLPDLDTRQGVVVEVFARLVEELAGQRHVLLVDVIHVADERDVRDTLAITGRDDARHHALKTPLEIRQLSRERHRRRVPARGSR